MGVDLAPITPPITEQAGAECRSPEACPAHRFSLTQATCHLIPAAKGYPRARFPWSSFPALPGARSCRLQVLISHGGKASRRTNPSISPDPDPEAFSARPCARAGPLRHHPWVSLALAARPLVTEKENCNAHSVSLEGFAPPPGPEVYRVFLAAGKLLRKHRPKQRDGAAGTHDAAGLRAPGRGQFRTQNRC